EHHAFVTVDSRRLLTPFQIPKLLLSPNQRFFSAHLVIRSRRPAAQCPEEHIRERWALKPRELTRYLISAGSRQDDSSVAHRIGHARHGHHRLSAFSQEVTAGISTRETRV